MFQFVNRIEIKSNLIKIFLRNENFLRKLKMRYIVYIKKYINIHL